MLGKPKPFKNSSSGSWIRSWGHIEGTISPARLVISKIPCCVRQLFSCFLHHCGVIKQGCQFAVLLLTGKAISLTQLPLTPPGALSQTQTPPVPLTHPGSEAPLPSHTAFTVCTEAQSNNNIPANLLKQKIMISTLFFKIEQEISFSAGLPFLQRMMFAKPINLDSAFPQQKEESCVVLFHLSHEVSSSLPSKLRLQKFTELDFSLQCSCCQVRM